MLKFKPNSEPDSYRILIFTNMPFEFLNHWNINSYMKNIRQHQKETKTILPKRLTLAKKNKKYINSEVKLNNLVVNYLTE